jgi:pilus assembly protein CpaB
MLIRLAFFGLMALGLAGFGTVAWIATRPEAPSAAQVVVVPKVRVLTAAHAIHAGALLKPDDLGFVELVKGTQQTDSSIDTPDNRASILGAMVRRTLAAKEEIHSADLLRPGDRGFLAAVLRPGSRAVTVAVDAVTGSAGLIWPGDHVDLILTQSLLGEALPVGRRVAAETVLSDVRVIAIDQQLVQGAEATPKEAQARTVTLELNAEEAERVSVAVRLGRLSLAVRAATASVVDPSAPPAETPRATTWADDVSPALRGGRVNAPAPTNSMRVYQGAADGKEYRF